MAGMDSGRGWIQGADGYSEVMDTARGAEPQAPCGAGRRSAAFAGASLIVRGQAEGPEGVPVTPAGWVLGPEAQVQMSSRPACNTGDLQQWGHGTVAALPWAAEGVEGPLLGCSGACRVCLYLG